VSRIGKLPISVPEGVKISLEGHSILLEGPKGKLRTTIPVGVKVKVDGKLVKVERDSDQRKLRALHGLMRKLIANMVEGVSRGFSRVLEINGVGYRAEVKGSELHLSLGYSHPIVYTLPAGVSASIERQTVINLQSADKQLLGETAATIRSLRPPEPYKGKGVKYREEVIKRKAGKAVGSAGSA
jgi:large subunit ribosomal protein L6